ncbi:MFS transporter [Serratia sp. M24T3]|uniref:MFS transporter n=1 Tax=Serratia sp. M24T3 TaxID=932213 RepID=UPI00025B9BCE|nr:MFS transporter [Serratia sp. M24T3]EIC84266.1 hypothetical protein SPM24T3_12344 [Serratia sp. M24T3]
MRTTSALFLLFGTLFMAAGYGATFLISSYFSMQGGSDIDTGIAMSFALIGTLIGVPLVGWFAGLVEAAWLAAIAALTLAAGFLMLGSSSDNSGHIINFAALLIGLGWGMFYISGPMALSERINDLNRGSWFTRFSAFQMAGICGGPILLTAIVEQSEVSLHSAFNYVGLAGVLASFLLIVFGVKERRSIHESATRSWVKKLPQIGLSSAIRPIIMVGLGGCVFSAIMTFQSSLVDGTGSRASTFFAVHAVTVVVSRLLFARYLSVLPRLKLVSSLMLCLILGVLCMLGLNIHPSFQIMSAVLTGLGYGLVYPVIQTWAINESDLENRHAALTWFVISYFVGIFGFPVFGGWVLVEAGKVCFISLVAVIASLELAVATVPAIRRTHPL